jgi:LPS export ABC transporter protein LptC
MYRLPTSLLLLLVVLVALVPGCNGETDVAVVAPELEAMDADFIIVGGEQYLSQDGRTEAHLVYDTAFQWNDSTMAALRRVELVVFHEDGTERARVTADRGRFDQSTDRMIAQGNVVLVIPGDGRTLRTEELHYDPQAGQIWSDSAFVMDLPHQTLRGRSFRSDLEFRNFEARGRQ